MVFGIHSNTASNIYSGEFSIGFSDSVILGISIVGLTALAYTVHSIYQLHFKNLDDKDIDDENLTDEQRLCRSDVSTLSRAQRRARAKAIMKEQRRLIPGTHATADQEENPANAAHEVDNDNIQEDHIGGGIARSRKERQHLAKAAEREERRLFQEERERQQRAAQMLAQQQKQERLLHKEQRLEEAQRQNQLAAELRKQQEQYEWRTFLKAHGCAAEKSVSEFVEDCQNNRVVDIQDIADRYGVERSNVVQRIEQLISERRIAGFFQDSQRFVYVADMELQSIASRVMEQGFVSIEQLTKICEQSIGLEGVN